MNFQMKIGVIFLGVVLSGGFVVVPSAMGGMIADAKLAGPGVEVTVDNVVISSTTDLISAATHKDICIQDASGGMIIFGDNDNMNNILTQAGEGDVITFTGTTTLWNGTFEFRVDTNPFSIVRHDYAGVPSSVPITLADLQDNSIVAENAESTLAIVSGVTFVDAGGVFDGETDYEITDGVHTGKVRVSTFQQDLVGTAIPSGVVDITGIVSQWDLDNPPSGTPGVGYYLRVRNLADIVPEPATLSLFILGGIVALRRRR